jgi:hypothetical protein
MNKQQSGKAPKLDRQKLIVLVQKLLDVEGTFEEEQEQWKALEANFPDWLSVLIDIHYVIGDLHSMTAEEVVDKGLAWKPIILPEKLDRSEQ